MFTKILGHENLGLDTKILTIGRKITILQQFSTFIIMAARWKPLKSAVISLISGNFKTLYLEHIINAKNDHLNA